SFEEGEIRDDSVFYNDGCIKDCMEKNLEDDAGEIIRVHSQGDCGNVTTDDNEDVTPVIAPEKDSIIAPPSTPPGNDLNIAVESGSSWIDYIGPLTSDEIDSDKRWSYRDPNGNIHGLFSLAQIRSWQDYFPSDLEIWSYYGNVKEVILLHNALSRQTKDAVAANVIDAWSDVLHHEEKYRANRSITSHVYYWTSVGHKCCSKKNNFNHVDLVFFPCMKDSNHHYIICFDMKNAEIDIIDNINNDVEDISVRYGAYAMALNVN
ncbi:zinc finger CCCH domain-containing protein 19, partial [Tanacetum coccineum]